MTKRNQATVLAGRTTTPTHEREMPNISCLLQHAKWLRECAAEIAKSGNNGWGNTCINAADAIEQHAACASESP
jgi:hypothetical protein